MSSPTPEDSPDVKLYCWGSVLSSDELYTSLVSSLSKTTKKVSRKSTAGSDSAVKKKLIQQEPVWKSISPVEVSLVGNKARGGSGDDTLGPALISVEASDNHIIGVTSEFQTVGSGDNSAGQLLPMESVKKFIPFGKGVKVALPMDKRKIVQVACGKDYTACITKEGRVYTFGGNRFGQLGHSQDRQTTYVGPRMVHGIPHEVCVLVTCGDYSTYVLTKHGKIYACGYGRNGRLGISGVNSKIASQLQKSEAKVKEFKVLFLSDLNKKEVKKLGLSTVTRELERNVDEMKEVCGPLKGAPVISLAAGAAHCLAVTITGKVYGWGSNSHGQLGLKNVNTGVTKAAEKDQTYEIDEEDDELQDDYLYEDGIPEPTLLGVSDVIECSAGAFHSMFLKSCRTKLYAAGSNWNGQLGLDETGAVEEIKKVSVSSHAKGRILKIACGSKQSVVGFESGDALVFGGQYDHSMISRSGDSIQFKVLSKHISKVQCSDEVSGMFEVACGGDMVYVLTSSDAKRLIGLRMKARTILKDVYPIGINRKMVEKANKQLFYALRRALFDMHSLNASFVKGAAGRGSAGFETSGVDFEGMVMSMELFSKSITEKGEKLKVRQLISSLVAQLSKSAENVTEPDQLRAYFILALSPLIQRFSPREHELLLVSVFKLPAASRRLLFSWFFNDVGAKKITFFLDLLVKPMLARLDEHIKYKKYTNQAVLLCKFLHALYIICRHPDVAKSQQDVPSAAFYTSAMDSFPEQALARTYQKWKAVVTKGGSSLNPGRQDGFGNAQQSDRMMQEPPSLFGPGNLLAFLLPRGVGMSGHISMDPGIQRLNSTSSNVTEHSQLEVPVVQLDPGPMFGLDKFGLELVSVLDNSKKDTLNEVAPEFVMFKHPFLLSANMKRRFMQIDDRDNQVNFYLRFSINNINPNFILEVRRGEKMFEDTLTVLSQPENQKTMFLRRPLRVKFKDEDGLDAGGVRKEFFLLLSAAMFSPDISNFEEVDSHSHTIWFSNTLEVDSKKKNKTIKYGEYLKMVNDIQDYSLSIYNSIGTIMGLAVYNDTLLDVQFPQSMYQLLLKDFSPDALDLIHYKQFDPKRALLLESILEQDPEELAELDMRFEVTQSYQGLVTNIELCKNGETRVVTAKNRQEYVELYIKFHMYSPLIEKRAKALTVGFNKVITSNQAAFKLFNADELELLLCGTPELDFSLLKANCEYEGGFHPQHRTVKRFWQIVERLDYEQRKLLLKFCTGSSRAPVGGLKNVKFKIQRAGPDSPQLPTASTCFNTLIIPDYATKDKMQKLLLLAIENSEGFGLQ